MSAPFLVVYIILLLALIVYEVLRRRRSDDTYQGAESWPVTQSTIEFVDVWAEGRRRNKHYVAELAYSYSVDGHFYSGFYRGRFPDEKTARAFAENYRGKNLPVRYKPGTPETSLMTAPD